MARSRTPGTGQAASHSHPRQRQQPCGRAGERRRPPAHQRTTCSHAPALGPGPPSPVRLQRPRRYSPPPRPPARGLPPLPSPRPGHHRSLARRLDRAAVLFPCQLCLLQVATCSCSADLHLLLLAPPPSKIKREGGADGGPLALALPPHHHHALACAPRASPPPPPPPAPPRRRRPGPRPPRPRLRLIQAPVPPRPRRPPVSPPRRAPRPRRCVYVHTFPPQHLCDP